MPKAKPTQVITHRIELGTFERERLGPYFESKATSNNLQSIGIGLVGVGILAGAYAAYKIGHSIYDWADDIYDGLRENMRKAKEGWSKPVTADTFENPFDNDGFNDEGVPTNIFGLPGWGIWPGVI